MTAKENLLTTVLVNFGKIWLEKRIARAIQITLFLFLLQLAIIIIFFSRLPPEVPLFFSLPWGEPQLVSSGFLFLLPFLSLIILFINTLLATITITSNKFLSVSLVIGSSFFALFNLVAVIKIINRIL